LDELAREPKNRTYQLPAMRDRTAEMAAMLVLDYPVLHPDYV
jgi:hypothetical protein